MCDSFNTPEALGHLRELVSRTNIYINAQGKNLNVGLVDNIARWVGMMLRMFGLGEGQGEKSEIGWGTEGLEGEESVNVSPAIVGLHGKTLLTSINGSSEKRFLCHTFGHCPLSEMVFGS